MSEVNDITIAKKLLQLSQSAKDRDMEFNLTLNTVRKLLNQKRCYYTNVIFEETGANSRTVDRVDSSLGYIEGNVVACTQEFNSKKCNLTISDIELLFHKTRRFLPKKMQSGKPG